MAVCAYNSTRWMSDAEIEALRLCKDDFRLHVDPILVASKLSHSGYLSQSLYSTIINMFEQELERTRICECLISNLPFCGVTLPNLVTIINECGYKKLASKLFLSYLKVNGHCPRHVPKSSSGQRPTVHAFFRRLKRMVHDAQLKDPREFLRKLANRFANKIENEANEMKRQVLADECAAILGAEIDAIAITFDNNLCNNEVFTQMKSIIPKTSNTLIVDVQYYGRLANANAIIGNFEHGENMLVAARCRAYIAGPCLELVNMLYIEVYVRLWQYENNPAKSTQESLLFWGRIGLESLEEEEVDTKTLWRRMFILRMVFCLLGIGNRANIIPGCTVTEANISEAIDLLADIDRNWDGIEARRKMFYYVAKARLSELTLDITQCDIYIRKAAELATEGRFAEIQFIKEYSENISRRIHYSAVCQRELAEIINVPTRQSHQIRNSPDRPGYTTASHDPDRPGHTTVSHDPDRPGYTTVSHDPDQPSVRRYVPVPDQHGHISHKRNEPGQISHTPNWPGHTTVTASHDPDQPNVRRYDPDQHGHIRNVPSQSGNSGQMRYHPVQTSRIESNIDSDESKNISNNYVILQSNTSISFRGSMCRQRADTHPQLSFQGLQSSCSQTEKKCYAAEIMSANESTVDTYAQYNELLHEHVPTSVGITRHLPRESHSSNPCDNVMDSNPCGNLIDPNPCDHVVDPNLCCNVMEYLKCSDHDTSSLRQNVDERKHVLTRVEVSETQISEEVGEGKPAEIHGNVLGEADMICNCNTITLFESRGEPSGRSNESIEDAPDIRNRTTVPKPMHTKLTLFDTSDTQTSNSRGTKYDGNRVDNDSIKSDDLFGE